MTLLGRVAPPLVLMVVIYLLSDQSDLNSGLGTADLVLRKCAHAAEYGLLFLLTLRAFGWRWPLLAAAIAIGYAATDEWHQASVNGRHGTPVDVLIDASGVAIAATLHLVFGRRIADATAPLRARLRGRAGAHRG